MLGLLLVLTLSAYTLGILHRDRTLLSTTWVLGSALLLVGLQGP